MTPTKSSPKLKSEKWVVNASPVIALSRIGQAELLIQLPDQIILPQAVAEEISAGPENDPARQAVEDGLFEIVETPSPPSEVLAWDLGKGETAVLSFTLSNPDWTAILDDGAARRCARSFSLPITGTLSVVILAKQYGLIESAAQVLRALQSNDFRLEDAVIRAALERTVGENW
jgi:predicted nucleic acid-binding protein